ncbi:hypothetical protein AAG570_001745 [Ranatra chinensis]|uniref:Alpha-methylacyl-CoA racemase n=1 Tax=Ranatra chinensis TaxID=642074 RepID=A0ABD0Y9E6_9HEMI
MALKGVRVMEFAGLAPAPYCGMVLADFGASVVRIDKAHDTAADVDCLGNGKSSIAIDLKHPKGIDIVKRLTKKSDVLIECYRPGVMEKLGIGPKVLMSENERLIYARLSGFGQTGPLAKKAGHDINFISVSGLLSSLKWSGTESPVPPLNLAGDFGGGGLMCALGIVMALYERTCSGRGQLIDCDMTSGSAYLASWLFRSRCLPIWESPPGHNFLDGGYHAYNVYKTKDDLWMSVGALEPKFYMNFLTGIGLSPDLIPESNDEAKKVIGDIFKQKTQDEWCKVYPSSNCCLPNCFK